MLKFGNKEFRNLQEQVLKNMRDIQDVMQGTVVLAEFGIKVVGQVNTAAELPDPATYEGEFGDAYIVGTEEPYKYYIFTRAFEGQDTPSWFDLGIFPVPGPQGPKGDTGETGPQGQTGATGADGLPAGFGTVSATATTLTPGSDATVSVSTSGPNTEKSFVFTFGIPKGEQGVAPVLEWGNITGDISDQSDLISVLQSKQNTLVSGTNIKTINGSSVLGSGNLTIQSSIAIEYGDTTFDAPDILEKAKSGCPIYVQIANEQGELQVFHLHTAVVNSQQTQIQMFFINEFTNGAQTAAYMSQVKFLYNSGTITWSEPETIALGGSTGVAWGDITGTLSNQTDLQTALNGKQATISDLSTIRSGAAAGATAVQPGDLAAVATSGSYTDLSNKPSIPTKTSDLTNDSGYITGITSSDVTTALGYTPGTSNFSGAYADLTGKPDLSVYAKTSDLSTVAFSGSYVDLSNKPTIPSVSANPATTTATLTGIAIDGTSYAVSAVAPANMVTTDTAQTITGAKNFTNANGISVEKIIVADNIIVPTIELGEIITTGTQDYIRIPQKAGTMALTNDIPVTDVTLGGTSVLSSGIAVLPAYPTVPTTVSSFTNDAGYITSSALSGYATETYVQSYHDSTKQDVISDLATIRSGAALGATAVQPSALATVATTGDYDDLINKPNIPTKTSDLTNDSGFITSSALSGYATESYVQGYHDSTKQDVISDLATIRSGAALGATAVQPAAISDMATQTWVGQQGYLTGITSGMVITALGYTPLQSVTPTSETWTFTLSDGTTTTKTIVTAVTSA